MTAIDFILILFVVLVMIICAFIAGLKLSDKYYRQFEEDKRHSLEKQYLRLIARADADDPAAPYVAKRRVQLPPEFEARLRQNKRATMTLNNPNS